MLAAAPDRIARAVDRGRTVVLRNHVPVEAQSRFDRGLLAPGTILSYATLRLKPAAGIETFLADQRNPSSPDYHRWLTPGQFGDRFGLSPNDLDKLAAWLRSEGLQVNDVAQGRLWITFSGTAASVAGAFHTEIRRYQVNGEAHFSNATEPAIPAAFEEVVSGVDGLNDFDMRPMYQTEKQPRGPFSPEFTSGASRYLAPEDVATIYNIAPLYAMGLDGSGQKVAVIGRSDIDIQDIRIFRKSFNLPDNDPQMLLFGTNPGVTSSSVESDLDIEWAGAVAPNATIVYVYASSVTTAAQYAVDQNAAPVITFSYGSCEPYNNASFQGVAQQANAQGITWLSASGDWGAAICDVTSPTPQASKGPAGTFPATIPEITAVGGTEFDDGDGNRFWAPVNTANGGSALSYVPERAWNDSTLRNDLSATGGGPSVLFAKPGWQSGPGVPNDDARDTPDIAFPASPQRYAYIVYANGDQLHIGGTSVASPVFAGVLALLNQALAKTTQAQPGLGNINPALYRLAQTSPEIFHDVVVGDNRVPCSQSSPACTGAGMGYSAGAGYDLATGLGSLDVYRFVTGWKTGTASTTTLAIQPGTVNVADTVHLMATVAGRGGTPTGSVTFLANDASVGSALLSSTGTAVLNVSAVTLAAGNGTVSALYAGDSVFEGSSGSATIQLATTGTGSMVVPFITPNPVPQSGSVWPYVVGLTEKAGVATTLTGFTVDGFSQNLSFWTSTNIPANGTVRASLAGNSLTVPVDRLFAFTGRDADGRTWRQEMTVPFVAGNRPSLAPSIVLSGAPSTVLRNPHADACQWSQQITVQETAGFQVQLASFIAGSTSLSSQIQQLFGTTRLAPYGILQATVCSDNLTPPVSRLYQLGGTSELGTPVFATLSVSFTAEASAAPALAVSPAAVTFSGDGTASLNLRFDGGDADWTAVVLPANRTTSWLTISPRSGTGAAEVTIQASAAALANGVYRALISIQAPNALPQALLVPVVLVVGGSQEMTVSAVRNNASGAAAIAPGMQAVVYGSQLAASSQSFRRPPLPFALAGVSATVNGVSAPLYAVSPGQINLQIPYETGIGPAVLAINNNGKVAFSTLQVGVAAPGIDGLVIDNTTGQRGQARAGDALTLFFTGAGDLTPSLATGAAPPTGTPTRNLPRPRLPVSITIGGVPATITSVGNPSGMVGLMQLNCTVPAAVTPGAQPVVVTVGDAASDPVNITILASDS
ncbi:MAG: peptidase S8 [Terriglobia bacterium]|nr:MAG: peptidase S8 [Terriglobia bacterium]